MAQAEQGERLFQSQQAKEPAQYDTAQAEKYKKEIEDPNTSEHAGRWSGNPKRLDTLGMVSKVLAAENWIFIYAVLYGSVLSYSSQLDSPCNAECF